MIAGMWFQDLFNYDFRRTEMCIIPYATQQGEISFCAYNTGIGWRKIIENMYKNATVAQWYKEHGKHEIYAKGRAVSLDTYEHSLVIDPEDAARVRHLDHEVPNTAAEENRARRRAEFLKEEARVRKMYEELVLKQAPQEVVQIGSLTDIKKATPSVAPVPDQQRQWKRERRSEAASGRAGCRRLVHFQLKTFQLPPACRRQLLFCLGFLGWPLGVWC